MGSTGKILGAEPYMSTASQWGHPRSIAFPVKPFLFVAIDLRCQDREARMHAKKPG